MIMLDFLATSDLFRKNVDYCISRQAQIVAGYTTTEEPPEFIPGEPIETQNHLKRYALAKGVLNFGAAFILDTVVSNVVESFSANETNPSTDNIMIVVADEWDNLSELY